jgi:hypothetical protein
MNTERKPHIFGGHIERILPPQLNILLTMKLMNVILWMTMDALEDI